jgi:hypothetical protein
MISLTSTARFFVFDIILIENDSAPESTSSSKMQPPAISLPLLCDYISNALTEYHKYVPDDMDWDIYEACAISIKEQRALNPKQKDGVPVLTYGEINFDCFAEVLYDLKVNCALKGKFTIVILSFLR